MGNDISDCGNPGALGKYASCRFEVTNYIIREGNEANLMPEHVAVPCHCQSLTNTAHIRSLHWYNEAGNSARTAPGFGTLGARGFWHRVEWIFRMPASLLAVSILGTSTLKHWHWHFSSHSSVHIQFSVDFDVIRSLLEKFILAVPRSRRRGFSRCRNFRKSRAPRNDDTWDFPWIFHY